MTSIKLSEVKLTKAQIKSIAKVYAKSLVIHSAGTAWSELLSAEDASAINDELIAIALRITDKDEMAALDDIIKKYSR